LRITSAAALERGEPVLTIRITDPEWSEGRWTPFVPDHGKLMHMFLIRDDHAAFAHLHPLRVDSSTFRQPLPPLLPGRYRLFADVVHESGFTQTLLDSVTLPAFSEHATGLDADDSWLVASTDAAAAAAAPVVSGNVVPGNVVPLGDGS